MPLILSVPLPRRVRACVRARRYVNDRSVRGKELRGALAETGLHCYLQMLLADNFIHAVRAW